MFFFTYFYLPKLYFGFKQLKNIFFKLMKCSLPHQLKSSSLLIFFSSNLGEGGLQSMLGNMDQQQMMQLLSGGGLGGLGESLFDLIPYPSHSVKKMFSAFEWVNSYMVLYKCCESSNA